MKKVGVLGGGQLARMLALAGYPLGISLLCYEAAEDSCASQVTSVMQGDYLNEASLIEFAKSVDCVTIETENLPIRCAELVAQHTALMPNVETLRMTQDRLLEKQLLRSLGIPTADFSGVTNREELVAALASQGFPAVLKTRRQGYDGKGQVLIRDQESVERAWQQLHHEDLILESFIPFTKEISLISASSVAGDVKFYPLVMNEHREGILRVSRAPFMDAGLQAMAEAYALKLIKHFGYVGVMTIEFFVVDGRLIVNEIAPRVHNSGHWTIEGAVISQFENHLRAVMGLPLGETSAVGCSVMFNLIGTEPPLPDILSIPGAHYHSYGKQPRPGRKLGHITVNHADPLQAEILVNRIKA